jgi:hypothetical protein
MAIGAAASSRAHADAKTKLAIMASANFAAEILEWPPLEQVPKPLYFESRDFPLGEGYGLRRRAICLMCCVHLDPGAVGNDAVMFGDCASHDSCAGLVAHAHCIRDYVFNNGHVTDYAGHRHAVDLKCHLCKQSALYVRPILKPDVLCVVGGDAIPRNLYATLFVAPIVFVQCAFSVFVAPHGCSDRPDYVCFVVAGAQ